VEFSEKKLEEPIETTHFVLEPIVVEHADKIFKYLDAVELYTYIPIDPPDDLELLRAKYKRWSHRYSQDEKEVWINYAIYSASKNEYLGTLQATVELQGKTYIAYEVFPQFWRTGVAKEAVTALIKYLHFYFGIKIITAHVDTRNESSCRLLESLNFSRVSFIKDADFFKGRSSDEYVYEFQLRDQK
jgi:ribosomal-protein-alanine N-acetyltransferase